MNRTIRNLVIAVPLATVGLTMVNTGAATAGPNGPDVIVIKPKGGDPLPPKPKFDNDLPLADKPKPKKPAPKPAPKPKAAPQAVAPATTADEVVETAAVVETLSAHGSADSIDRADTLFVAGPAETELVADQDTNGGLDLTWLLIGGGIVTATGIAVAARKRQHNA